MSEQTPTSAAPAFCRACFGDGEGDGPGGRCVLCDGSGSVENAAIKVLKARVAELRAERDQFRRDYMTMSAYAAQLATHSGLAHAADAYERGKRAGAAERSDSLIESRIEAATGVDMNARAERVAAWLARDADDKEAAAAAAALESARERIGQLESQLRALADLISAVSENK